jgi:hypothetical protein
MKSVSLQASSMIRFPGVQRISKRNDPVRTQTAIVYSTGNVTCMDVCCYVFGTGTQVQRAQLEQACVHVTSVMVACDRRVTTWMSEDVHLLWYILLTILSRKELCAGGRNAVLVTGKVPYRCQRVHLTNGATGSMRLSSACQDSCLYVGAGPSCCIC